MICWGRLAGQAFSGGYDTKEIADRLKAVFPDGRIVVVVREQRSMIVSTYKQYLKAGGPSGIEAFLQPGSDQGWRIPLFDFDYFRVPPADRLLQLALRRRERARAARTRSSSATGAAS